MMSMNKRTNSCRVQSHFWTSRSGREERLALNEHSSSEGTEACVRCQIEKEASVKAGMPHVLGTEFF